MTQVFADISISLDGFGAGPNPTLEQPLGEGGEQLHEWAFQLASFRERHGLEGGVRDEDDAPPTRLIGGTPGESLVVTSRRQG